MSTAISSFSETKLVLLQGMTACLLGFTVVFFGLPQHAGPYIERRYYNCGYVDSITSITETWKVLISGKVDGCRLEGQADGGRELWLFIAIVLVIAILFGVGYILVNGPFGPRDYLGAIGALIVMIVVGAIAATILIVWAIFWAFIIMIGIVAGIVATTDK